MVVEAPAHCSLQLNNLLKSSQATCLAQALILFLQALEHKSQTGRGWF